MDIGKPQRIIMVEPLDVELPVEGATEAAPIRQEPKQAPPGPLGLLGLWRRIGRDIAHIDAKDLSVSRYSMSPQRWVSHPNTSA
jgi:hypothetical protein